MKQQSCHTPHNSSKCFIHGKKKLLLLIYISCWSVGLSKTCQVFLSPVKVCNVGLWQITDIHVLQIEYLAIHSWIWNKLISVSDYRYTRARDNKNTLQKKKQYNTWVIFANANGWVTANIDHLHRIFIVHSLQTGIKFCILDFVLAEKNNEKCQNWCPAFWNFSTVQNNIP
jgi:hypothetical protein